MKNLTVLVEYSTNEKINKTEHTHQLKSKFVEVKPIKIFRISCGWWGEAKHRYFYQVSFKAPSDAAFSFDGLLTSNINRKMNPKFKPKDFVFVNDVCDLTGVNQ